MKVYGWNLRERLSRQEDGVDFVVRLASLVQDLKSLVRPAFARLRGATRIIAKTNGDLEDACPHPEIEERDGEIKRRVRKQVSWRSGEAIWILSGISGERGVVYCDWDLKRFENDSASRLGG